MIEFLLSLLEFDDAIWRTFFGKMKMMGRRRRTWRRRRHRLLRKRSNFNTLHISVGILKLLGILNNLLVLLLLIHTEFIKMFRFIGYFKYILVIVF